METNAEIKTIIEQAYYLVGFLVLSGFGALVSSIIFVVKKSIWIARVEFRVEALERDLNEAFKKIREEERNVKQLRELRELSQLLRRDETD